MGELYDYMLNNEYPFIHVTEYKNLKNILESGGLLSLEEIEKQGKTPVYISSQNSRMSDKYNKLDGYIRLAYTHQYDMLPAAIYYGDLKEPVIILIKPEVLTKNGIKYTTKNAVTKGCIIYDTQDEVIDKLDFEKMHHPRNYTNASVQQYKDARQSEVLIPNNIETKFFHKILIPEGSDRTQIKTDIPIYECDTKKIIHP